MALKFLTPQQILKEKQYDWEDLYVQTEKLEEFKDFGVA